MAYTLTFDLVLGASQAGLTLQAQLVDTAGANVGSAVTTGFVEIGGGYYEWTYAAFPDGFRGGVKFSTTVGGVLKAFAALNPTDGEYIALIKAKTDLLGTGAAVAISPVTTSGQVTLIHGDDYYNADGRALTFTSTSWPSVTGATNVKLTFGDVTYVGAVVDASTVRFELTAAQTTAIKPREYPYDIQVTLATGHIATLATGTVLVKVDLTP